MRDISKQDQNRLMQLEKVIDRNQKAAMDWYEALAEIHERKLWRAGYDSWKDYCETRWGLAHQVVNRKIKAGAVQKQISKQDANQKGLISPISDGAALELARVPESEREAVIERASENGKPTAAAIRRVVGEEKKKPKAIRGIDPWAKDVCQQLKNLKRGIEGMASSPDGQWIGPLDKLVKALDYVHGIVDSTKFGETCRECKGKGCKNCRQSGWLPKWKVEELEA